MTRRTFMAGAAMAPVAMAAGAPGAVYAYVGCFTTASRKGRGDGIHVYRIEPGTGNWTQVQVLTGLVNPSFLAMGKDGRVLYSSHGDEEYASAYTVDAATGEIKLLNKAATGGKNGAHIALSPGGNFLVVANYSAGTVSVLPVKADGGLGDYTQLLKMEGEPGPHRVEQPGSHPHQIVFDPSGKFVLVPDKGLDRVFVFSFDAATGRLTPGPTPSERTRSGAGPRHLAFHPKLSVVWVLNELGNTVTTYNWDGAKGSLTAVQTLPTLPENFTGDSTAAELAVTGDGKFLYTSNRGHDSLATFQVNPKTGLLKAVTWTSSGGKIPRFITIEPGGKTLLAANEQGDTITRFTMNPGTGALKSMGAPIANGTPVTVAFKL